MKTFTLKLKETFVSVLIATLLLPMAAIASPTAAPAKPLSDDQKVLHVLNRLGFGARPGDVERVKAMGLQKYMDQQLSPSSINDATAEAKLKGLDIFSMSTAELFAKYPNPGALLQQLEGGRRAQQAAAGDKDGDKADDQRERRQKIAEIYEKYDLKNPRRILPEIVSNRVLRAVYSERQLQEVMVDFWQNHFNVFAGKAAVRWYIPSYERDVLRPNALGNFKDLVTGTASHPAMLFYLDNFESRSPNSNLAANRGNGGRIQQMIRNGEQLPPRARERLRQQYGVNDAQLDQRLKEMRGNAPAQQQQRRTPGINENYARELMELHTLGVDGGYSQKDIVEVAKAFTGWTIADPRGYRRAAAATIQGTEDRRIGRIQRMAGVPDDVESGQFYFNPTWHEPGTKTVLGKEIKDGGVKDALKVIDILVEHPSTAKFIARKLAVKFVSDNPSDALVGRVADAFRTSKGDIKTTLKALFSDKEFFAPENYRAKIKSPFELAVSSIRVLGGNTNVSPAMVAMLNKLGEVPYGYQAPTGYPDSAEDWVNTGALLERLNFAVAVASNRIPGTRVDLKPFAGGDKTAVLGRAMNTILAGEVSESTRASLIKQVQQPLPEVKEADDPIDAELDMPNMRGAGEAGAGRRGARLLAPSGDAEVFKIVGLVLGSPEFQRQ